MRILFATSEAYPLIKTGGLADVSGSLPRALVGLGHDVRLLLPAYRDVLEKTRALGAKAIATFDVQGQSVTLLETRLPSTRVKVWLLACPAYFERPGNPYHNEFNQPWPDNDRRFLLLARAAAMLAQNSFGLNWQPDILHCNDWQTALAPVLLDSAKKKPATIFTIHNLAYQGLYSHDAFIASQLPAHLWHYEALEFHSQFSFIKGGIVFADRITTVSPSYAAEIQTARFGCGLEGLLRHRSAVLRGILNGIDAEEWNPGTDQYLVQRFNRRTLALKSQNKFALQAQLGLRQDLDVPLFGFVGRLVEQKGVDWLLDSVPNIVAQGAQLVLLGSGAQEFEQALLQLSARHPDSISVTIGYNETLAHRIEASADIFLMPSRFEPCGLNQLYSLRYGTLPLVHRVGGLADTVTDTSEQTIAAGVANGFVFDVDNSAALIAAQTRALAVYRERKLWRQLQLFAMGQDFSWQHSALAYQALYEEVLNLPSP